MQLVVLGREEVRAFDLPARGEVTIGRDQASALCIDEPSVSRQHAVLRLGQSLEVEDLGGANGTFLRRAMATPLAAHALLEPPGGLNDTLRVTVQQLLRRKASLAVGDCLLVGTVCVVLRRAPNAEIPDLLDLGDPTSPARSTAPAMQLLYQEAARVARSPINVLLLGETGVGKEVMARAIHACSPRKEGPFLAVNCAALSESLFESELFGSERGAFTGATARAGLFEAAQGGTLFLDEIGELPLTTQAKLLRVLEERTVTRLGSTRPRAVDVRFVSATNRDVEGDCRQGRLRPDLYFRLAGVELTIPPLRERPGDIAALASSFLSAACRDMDRVCVPVLATATLDLLHAYSWPGNVRELRNVIERAVVMCTEAEIGTEHLPPSLLAAGNVRLPPSPPPSVSLAPSATLHEELKELERTRIVDAIERCGGNRSEAARRLGMPRRTLVSRLAELGLGRDRTVKP